MPEEQEENKTRKIIIETDGDNIEITKAEVSGMIELKGILRALLSNLNKS